MRLTIRQCLRANSIALLGLVFLLSACGTQGTTDPVAAHQAWVDAISNGNKTTAAAMSTNPYGTSDAFAQRAIAMVAPWTYQQSRKPGGPANAMIVASIWQQGAQFHCFETTLRPIDGRMLVTDFYAEADEDCTTTRQEAP